jgi:selenocysteine lyase/cysteine desulfurase
LETNRTGRADGKESLIADLASDEELRRHEFPICACKIYCAHAADAPLPRRVADAMRDSIERASTDSRQYELELEHIATTREATARFIGAEADEIAFTGPTSSGLNAIANGLDWKNGDEVVCYLDDYPANVYPWLALERQGVKPVLLEAARIGEITPEIVERALTKRTKLVALASANFCSGYRIDLDAIGALCAERGVLFSVDAIQTLGAIPFALDRIDFLSAGAQKWMLGPSGAGILYVKKSRRDLLRPATIGGWNVQSPNFIAQREIKFAAGGQKFEPGAYYHAAIAGLGAAVELLLEAGPAVIATCILSLTNALKDQIAPAGFEFLSPEAEKNRSGILTFRHPKIPSAELQDVLVKDNIVVSLRFDREDRSWLRVSPHFYNTFDEMAKIAGLLQAETTSSAARNGCV